MAKKINLRKLAADRLTRRVREQLARRDELMAEIQNRIGTGPSRPDLDPRIADLWSQTGTINRTLLTLDAELAQASP
jgi:hypothetical protein